jgi:hypothetical protein
LALPVLTQLSYLCCGGNVSREIRRSGGINNDEDRHDFKSNSRSQGKKLQARNKENKNEKSVQESRGT